MPGKKNTSWTNRADLYEKFFAGAAGVPNLPVLVAGDPRDAAAPKKGPWKKVPGSKNTSQCLSSVTWSSIVRCSGGNLRFAQSRSG